MCSENENCDEKLDDAIDLKKDEIIQIIRKFPRTLEARLLQTQVWFLIPLAAKNEKQHIEVVTIVRYALQDTLSVLKDHVKHIEEHIVKLDEMSSTYGKWGADKKAKTSEKTS